MRNLLILFFCVAIMAPSSTKAQTTVVLQPHFAAAQENTLTYVDSTAGPCIGSPHQYFSDSVHRYSPQIEALAWTAGGCPEIYRHILRFAGLSDTSIIPNGAIIISAKLIFYGIPSSIFGDYGNSYYTGSPYPYPNQMWLYELADSFNTNTVSWNAMPTLAHTDSISIPSSYSRWNETDTFDVTQMVADMTAHTNTGFGLQLQDETIYRSRLYAGCSDADSTLHPKLIVKFIGCTNPIISQPLTDTVTVGNIATFTVTGSVFGSTYQWQENPGTGYVSLVNVWPYSGVNTNTLTIQNAGMLLNGTHYRCIVPGNAPCSDTSSSSTLIVNSSTDVKTLTAASINIFPNPVHNELTVQLPDQVHDGSIELADDLGRILSQKTIVGNQVIFSFGNLPAGVYVLKIAANEQTIYKKVVKQ